MKRGRRFLAVFLALVLTVSMASTAMAFQDAFWDGYDEGWDAGYSQGLQDREEGTQTTPPQAEGGYDEGYIGGYEEGYAAATAPPTIPVSPEWSEYEREWLAAEFLTLGGHAGEINVQVNGRMVQFSAVWPENVDGRVMVPARAVLEALDAEVTFDAGVLTAARGASEISHRVGSFEAMVTTAAGAQTYTFDSESYLQSGTAMVPVRLFAEALDLTVYWDETFQTVVLLDTETMVRELDGKLRVANLLLSDAVNARREGVNYHSSGRYQADITVFDSLNGDQSYRATATSAGLSNRTAQQTRLKMDLSAVVDMTMAMQRGYGELSEEAQAQLTQLRQMMGGLEMQTIVDQKNGVYYFQSPLLDQLLGHTGWISQKFSPAKQPAATLAELVYAEAVTSRLSNTTAMLSGGYATTFPVYYHHSFQTMSDLLTGAVGDDKFSQSGSTYTVTLNAKKLAPLLGMDEMEMAWMLGGMGTTDLRLSVTDTGGGTCNYTVGATVKTSEMQMTLDLSKQALNSHITASLHVKNLFVGTWESTITTTVTDQPVPTRPPEGELVVNWEETPALIPALKGAI